MKKQVYRRKNILVAHACVAEYESVAFAGKTVETVRQLWNAYVLSFSAVQYAGNYFVAAAEQQMAPGAANAKCTIYLCLWLQFLKRA